MIDKKPRVTVMDQNQWNFINGLRIAVQTNHDDFKMGRLYTVEHAKHLAQELLAACEEVEGVAGTATALRGLKGILDRTEERVDRLLRENIMLANDRAALRRHLATITSSEPDDSDINPVCSCPSGDGSLRWPCQAHPVLTKTEPIDLKEIARKAGATIFDKCGSYGSYQAGSVLFTPAEWAHFAELMQKGSVKFKVKS